MQILRHLISRWEEKGELPGGSPWPRQRWMVDGRWHSFRVPSRRPVSSSEGRSRKSALSSAWRLYRFFPSRGYGVGFGELRKVWGKNRRLSYRMRWEIRLQQVTDRRILQLIKGQNYWSFQCHRVLPFRSRVVLCVGEILRKTAVMKKASAPSWSKIWRCRSKDPISVLCLLGWQS